MKRITDLKKEALAALKGNWLIFIGVTILFPLILSIIQYIISILFGVSFTDYATTYGYNNNYYYSEYGITNSLSGGTLFIYNIITLFFTLASSVALANIAFVFKDFFTRRKTEVSLIDDQLEVVRKGYLGKLALLCILEAIFIFLWSLLFIIPGIIKSLSYSQAYYIFKDKMDRNEDFKAIDCITESRKMMDGYKGTRFLLGLSFIGWAILTIFTLGIGLLWLTPYVNMTLVAFYENLKQVNPISKPQPNIREERSTIEVDML